MLRPSAIIAWIGATPSAVPGIFTYRFGSSIACVQRTGGRLGAGRVAGQLRSDLDRHVAVDAVAAVVHGSQEREGALDVGGDEVPVRVGDGRAAADEVAELLVVVGAGADRLLEDRRVRREAPDAAVDPCGQLAAR